MMVRVSLVSQTPTRILGEFSMLEISWSRFLSVMMGFLILYTSRIMGMVRILLVGEGRLGAFLLFSLGGSWSPSLLRLRSLLVRF